MRLLEILEKFARKVPAVAYMYGTLSTILVLCFAPNMLLAVLMCGVASKSIPSQTAITIFAGYFVVFVIGAYLFGRERKTKIKIPLQSSYSYVTEMKRIKEGNRKVEAS